MSGIQSFPEPVRRALIGGVILYFALVLVAVVTGNALANLLSLALFGVIAVGLGVVLIQEAEGERTPIRAAGILLVVAGGARFAWLVTGEGVFETVTTIGVIFGIAIYAYAVYVAS